ncbi:membrane protein [Mycobacterium marinum]|uniref:DUF3515 domain-containing protein n=1 Tax=Mycobacterium marinum TaxID=1781 RepID=UPI000E3DE9CD|nr:DUF3515 domain-containing protein [Mycobacterium marinum]RFZ32073.1 hypothetical protein KST_04671 [Mycobacterium marinum]GJP08595.1 membrane protein [Mycobacterium marinum]
MTGDTPAKHQPDPDGPPRVLIIAAALLGVAALGAILVIAANREVPRQPIAVPSVPAPQAASPACHALLTALPQLLGDYQRAPMVQPAPQGTGAWSSAAADEPVILRCGLDRPADFVVGAPIQVVDRVQWFRVSDQTEAAGTATAGSRSTWYTVDRPVYVALTLPAGSGPTPIQELSEIIDRAIAPVPIDPAPAG